ncbi:DNA repair protein [Actimicrobium sp. CCI2.3]|uniref:DNA repair protein n=1 Tax=Actimicrobium sp. CCI2.3 TaxID=3048616 RepID=UPI002AB59E63|nr:DNA repair protein [Actimicrobium sp. CCI2.3]MDY7574482.1 DNA repair protein [Actimicrobium sp. CCI2.3]MEB0023909.1 DNA repair protein [Actimicrobium sp. CCI2.3]
MKPLSLHLKGFKGIRDGLGRDSITLDFEQLAGDARLVAITGMNGRGKTTIIDNATPYPVMPSRAGADGLGSFSYYDHIYLPESAKTLTWEHAGRRYRSQLIFRVNGRKRTEAYLHVDHAGRWEPVALDDGTVSDGKVETYARCVDVLLGSPETFFTSVFSAQGRRPLSAYRNADIKALLADLLGLDAISTLGGHAATTAKLLRTGLETRRQALADLQREESGHRDARLRLGDVQTQTTAAEQERQLAHTTLEAAKSALATLVTEQQLAHQTASLRKQLDDERAVLTADAQCALSALDAQDRREAERLSTVERRVARQTASLQSARTQLDRRCTQYRQLLRQASTISRAVPHLPLANNITSIREQRLTRLRDDMMQYETLCTSAKEHQLQLHTIEREAGQAALRMQELTRRFGLTSQVPCAGNELQGRCELLGDARTAQTMKPSAEMQLARLHQERTAVLEKIAVTNAALARSPDPRPMLERAEQQLSRSRQRSAALVVFAARHGEVAHARQELQRIEAERDALPQAGVGDTEEDRAERLAIAAARTEISSRREQEQQRQQTSMRRIDTLLSALPPPFDTSSLVAGQHTIEAAQRTLAATDAVYLNAIRDQQAATACDNRLDELATRITAASTAIAAIEQALGTWLLLTKCLSHDGVIALAIDDAGPQLSGLANDLLLACYGPRFTVSIRTLVETGKGDLREGFDIVVHDGESDDSKSLTQMSGGERVFINECLIRAIALYLAQDAGRQYSTLFSDEADGPLDPERKRMFMAMKREVLRLGGYAQEFFVSQTPELTAMADAVIDLDRMVAG